MRSELILLGLCLVVGTNQLSPAKITYDPQELIVEYVE